MPGLTGRRRFAEDFNSLTPSTSLSSVFQDYLSLLFVLLLYYIDGGRAEHSQVIKHIPDAPLPSDGDQVRSCHQYWTAGPSSRSADRSVYIQRVLPCHVRSMTDAVSSMPVSSVDPWHPPPCIPAPLVCLAGVYPYPMRYPCLVITARHAAPWG